MTPSDPIHGLRDPVEELAEAFLARYRRGERPSVSEFVARAPDHADEIRDLFPALVLMEQAGPDTGTRPAAAPPAGPDRIGDYRILREVGRGGMGVVYEAEQEALGRHVALKVLPPTVAGDDRALIRFRREARSAARLHHTNIVPVYDVGERNGVHYYAMQFIAGQGLDAVIAELARLRAPPGTLPNGPPTGRAGGLAQSLMSGQFQPTEPPPAPDVGPVPDTSRVAGLTHRSDLTTRSDVHFYGSAARVGLQVAEALAYAHGQRVLHRDIKPSNLLLDAQGTAWVTDFGLAKEEGDVLTRTGEVVGTLRYMPPERFNGLCDARSDVYSLGLTLYELLTLRPAFDDADRVGLVQRIMQLDPIGPRRLDPHLPRDLETIVLTAIAKEPARRYASAAALAYDLRRFLADRPIRARRASQWEYMWRWCRRNPGWAGTAGAVLGLLVVIAVGGTVLSLHLRRALTDVQAADEEKNERLRQAHLERARALRSSGRVGHRFEALKAIREAARIRVTDELRDEAVAALVLPDVELDREWDGYPEDSLNIACDASLERYARINKRGEVTVCRLGLGGEEVVHRLPADDRAAFWGLWMSPDGRYVAYGFGSTAEGQSGGVRIWRVDGPAPVAYPHEPAGVLLHAFAFHPDGRRAAVGHPDGTMTVCDLESDAPPVRRRFGGMANSLAFDPKRGRLAAACYDAVRVLDVDTWAEGPVLRDPAIRRWEFGLAWHPDGRLLAATSEDCKIHVWDTETGAEAITPLAGLNAGIFMAYNPAGDRLLSVGWDRQTRLWDAVSGRPLLVMPGHFGTLFGPGGATIGLGRNGTRLTRWRLADGRELRHLRRRFPDAVATLNGPVLGPDDRLLAVGTENGLCVFDVRTGRELAVTRFGEGGYASPRGYDARDGWLTSGPGGGLLWPVRADPDRPNVLRVGPPRSLALSVRPGADATPDGRIRVFPVMTRSLHDTYALVVDRDRPGRRVVLGPQHDARFAAISPDGRWAATCSWFSDGRTPCARVWDAGTGAPVTDLLADGGSRPGFSPDNRWLVVQTNGRGCQLWEVETWRRGRRFDGDAFHWTPDGRHFVTTDSLGAIQFVEPDTGREALRLTGPAAVRYLPTAFTRDGATLVALSDEPGIIHVWDLRRIRAQLNDLGMDWALPEFPAAAGESGPPPEVELVPGVARHVVAKIDAPALAALDQAVAARPNDPDAYFDRALVHEARRDVARATADYEAAGARLPANDPRRPEVLRRRANGYYAAGNTWGAAATLADTLSAPADCIPHPAAYAGLCNNVAWRLAHPAGSRPTETVLRLAERAVEFLPFSYTCQNTYGVVLYRYGRFDDAARRLEKNLELSGRYAPFDLYFLAMSYQRLGQPAKARECCGRANAAVAPDAPFTADQRKELAAFRAEAESLLERGTEKSLNRGN